MAEAEEKELKKRERRREKIEREGKTRKDNRKIKGYYLAKNKRVNLHKNKGLGYPETSLHGENNYWGSWEFMLDWCGNKLGYR